MALIRWNPALELNSLQRQMNRLFDDFFGGSARSDSDQQIRAWAPLVDIREDVNAYYVHAEIPGVNKDEIKMTMNNNTLSIRGDKKQESENKSSNYHRLERTYGSFERSFTLPTTVKTDKIDASYLNGVLTVTLPKTEEAKPKEIQVKVQ